MAHKPSGADPARLCVHLLLHLCGPPHFSECSRLTPGDLLTGPFLFPLTPPPISHLSSLPSAPSPPRHRSVLSLALPKLPLAELLTQSRGPERKEACPGLHRQQQSHKEPPSVHRLPRALSPADSTVVATRRLCHCHLRPQPLFCSLWGLHGS